MKKNKKINVQGSEISVFQNDDMDFISLTDMTSNFKEGSGLIGKWITNKNTLEYLGILEKINNKNFNCPEFGVIEQEAGTNRFIMSAGQWLKRSNAMLIDEDLAQSERLQKPNQIAIGQMQILLDERGIKRLEVGDE